MNDRSRPVSSIIRTTARSDLASWRQALRLRQERRIAPVELPTRVVIRNNLKLHRAKLQALKKG